MVKERFLKDSREDMLLLVFSEERKNYLRRMRLDLKIKNLIQSHYEKAYPYMLLRLVFAMRCG